MLQPKIQKISTKGQVVIPAEFRRFLNLESGKVLIIPSLEEKKITVKSMTKDPIKTAAGILAGLEKSASQIMKEARQEEREFEKKKLSNLHF